MDFRGLKKVSPKELKEMVANMHRAKEGLALVEFTEIMPPDLLIKSGLTIQKKAENDEAPDTFTQERNVDITDQIVLPEELPALEAEEETQLERLATIVKGLDTTPDGKFGKEVDTIIKTLRQIMIEDKTRSAKNPTRGVVAAPGYKAIWNIDAYQRDSRGNVILDTNGNPMKGVLSCIATDRYKITQPRRSFGAFVDKLIANMSDTQQGNIYAKLEQSISYHDLAIIVDDPEYRIIPDDGRVINMGFHLGGGFRPGRSSYVGGWEIRRGKDVGGIYEPGCMNQFNISSAMGSVSLPHTNDEDTVIRKMVEYISNIKKRGQHLLDKINGAIKVDVPEEDVVWVMGAVGLTPNQVLDSYKVYKTQAVDEQGHMWGVYNAITQAVVNKYHIKPAEEKLSQIEELIDDPDEVFQRVKVLKEEAMVATANQ